ncbi:agmatinase [Myxococcota bacterium]|nr:agmatinase [Myxococcota bacterium]
MQQSAAEYIRSGQINFFRLPRVAVDAEGRCRYGDAEAVLVGAPFDGGATHEPGARFAPYHVRRVSALVQSFHPTHKVDVFGTIRAVDGGNLVLSPFAAGTTRTLVEEELGEVLSAGAAPFVVGGDHSIALAVLRALARRHGPLACVHVDAHFDTSGPEIWGEAHHHGTPFRHALVEELIAPGHLYQVGIRAPWGAADADQLTRRHGGHVFAMDEIHERGITRVAAQIREMIGRRPVYVSFDVDAVDPAFAPGTGTPVPGGLSSSDAIRLLRGLAGVELAGMDVVEVLPARDHADLTSHLAAHLLYEGLALYALRARLRRAERASGAA